MNERPLKLPNLKICFYFFSLQITASIQENRIERLSDEDHLKDAENVAKLRLKEDVLNRNLSPSLQNKK